MAIPKTASVIFTVFSRIVTTLFACLAFFAFFETQDILSGSSSYADLKIVDDKFMIPLVLCFPKDMNMDDLSDVSSGIKCQQMDFLINACSASLLFGAVASVSYVIIDWLARNKRGPFNMSAAAGMGIFLFFILMMTGITTGALVEQNQLWVEVYQEILDAQEATHHLTAEAYGNLTLIMAAAIFAFAASILNMFDLVLARCCGGNGGNSSSTADHSTPHKKQQESPMETVPNNKEKKVGSKMPRLSSPFPAKKSKDTEEDVMPTTTEPTIEYGTATSVAGPTAASPHDKPSWLA